MVKSTPQAACAFDDSGKLNPLGEILVFDIETIPDAEGYRKLHPELAQVSDAETLQIMQGENAAQGRTLTRLYLQKVVAISVIQRRPETGLKLWSLGSVDSDEGELIRRFFRGIDIAHSPATLVSWNGGGFDLPVLQQRGLIHGVSAARYFDTGREEGFRYNNYLSRYHYRHLDLMDLLARYQGNAWAPLSDIAKLCGFPGKTATTGADVLELWQRGAREEIRQYCESDVLNTYLVYLRFELLRGHLDETAYAAGLAEVRTLLEHSEAEHLRHFSW